MVDTTAVLPLNIVNMAVKVVSPNKKALNDTFTRLLASLNVMTLQRRGTDWYETARSQSQENAGQIIQIIQKDCAEDTTTTTTPAIDTTVPEVTEGDEAVSQVITLRDANSRVKVSFNAFLLGTAGLVAVFTIFRDSVAVVSTIIDVVDSSNYTAVAMIAVDTPASASALTYSVRWGVDGNTGYLNRQATGTVLGGAVNIANGLILEEIAG